MTSTTVNKTFYNFLEDINACEEACEWVKENNFTLNEAWQKCKRGDWMLWLIKKANLCDHRKLTLAKARCAKLVIHLMKDERSRKAIEVAEDYGNNKATKDDLAAAAYAAADDDKYLVKMAEIGLSVLIEMKSPGCEFLYLTEQTK